MNAELWMKAHENEMVEDICELVRIPSVSSASENPEAPFGEACRKALDQALALGRRMGFEAFNHENYCGSLYWRGETERELGFFGHTDVVPAGEGWTYPPFEPTVRDGLIIGRGASDNKGSFMAALYALRYLKEEGRVLKHSVRFFLGCSEEKGMEDVQYYAANYKLPEFSLVPDVMFPVCNGEKGIMELDAVRPVSSHVLAGFQSGIMSNAVPAHAEALLRLTGDEAQKLRKSEAFRLAGAVLEPAGELWRICAAGIPAHAAFPEGSESAEVKLADCLLKADVLDEDGARLMDAIVRLFGDYYGEGLDIASEDKASGKLTHVGGIASLEHGVFLQNINIRYNVTADYNQMTQRLEDRLRTFGFAIKELHNSAPCYTDETSPEVRLLTEICNEELGGSYAPYVMGGGTYARRLKHAVGYGPGIPGKAKRFGAERGGAHQADEYVEIDHLKQAFLIYVKAIQAVDLLLDPAN